MVSTRLALIAVGSVVAATFAVQESNAIQIRGSAAEDNTILLEKKKNKNKKKHAAAKLKGNLLEVGDGLEAQELNPIGCFKDTGSRALSGGFLDQGVTKEKCNEYCETRGFTYFGLQSSNQCFCGGADYGKYGVLPEASCQRTCTSQPEVMCGGTWANSVYKVGGSKVVEALDSEAELKGCYKDTSARAMAGSTFSGDVTPKTCSDFCNVLGFSYFGLQDHHYCYCGGADYGKYGTLKQDQCNTPCTSHPGVMCGGKSANSVYKIPGAPEAEKATKLEALGCYKDASKRAMGGNTFSGDVTPEICSDFCGNLGFSYFGLQHYDHCFCGGADYAKLGSLPEHKCDTPCNSLPSAMCGGTWANSVFKVRA